MSGDNTERLEFRPARKEDCRTIAMLFSLSSDGVSDYIWSQMTGEGGDIIDIGQKRYENEDSVFSYKSCMIAEVNGEIAGMLIAFPMFVDPEKNYSDTDPVLVPYEKLEEDNSYYICGVALFERFRGKGIGTEFMNIAEEKAKESGFGKLSLIVFEQNEGAKTLYERLGYAEVAREPVVPHPLIHYTGDAILMVKKI